MKAEPWTRARVEHQRHVMFVEDCEWCVRRLEENKEDTRAIIEARSTAGEQMDFCTIHGEVNCKQVSCFVCGNHDLDLEGRCTDPRCRAATTLRFEIRASGGEQVFGRLPTRAYANDAGLDLYAAFSYEIATGEFTDVDLGLRMACPDGYWARITGRSSGFRKRGFMVIEGVIDAGYRGPLYAGVWVPAGSSRVRINEGEKIAQMLIHRVERLEPVAAEELPESERGERGFGSSGT